MDDLLSIALSNAVAATVLALAAIAIGALYRRPALVHGLWLLVLLKLVTPPLMFLPVAWPTGADPPPEAAAVPDEPTIALSPVAEEERAAVTDVPFVESPSPDVDDSPRVDASEVLPPSPALWPQLLRIAWVAGALFWFLLAMERLRHFRRLLRFARPAPVALQDRTRRLAFSLGLRRCPRLRLLPGRIAPMLWAAGGPPRLLVPADLLAVLSEEQLDTLLLHELAHLRRRDHWVRVLEFVVMGLYWWHPVVWFARRELREAEEQCCDAWVVSTLPGAGRTYASALLDTLDFLSTAQTAVPPLASGLSQIADLKRRLTMIMQGKTPRSLTWPGCLAVVALALICLPMMPSLNGQTPTKEDAQKSVEQAEAALKHAKAALELQRALLETKRAELDAAQQRLAKESARAGEFLLKKEKLGPLHARIEKKTGYRIEITLPDESGANELIEKIRKVLPEKLRGNVLVRPVTEGYFFRFDGEHGTLALPSQKPPVSANRMSTSPAGRPRLPGDPNAKANPPQSKSSEKRINELEDKLNKVIHELRELRKQIGNSNPSAGAEPFSEGSVANPAPPAPPTPPRISYRPTSPRTGRSPSTTPPAPPRRAE